MTARTVGALALLFGVGACATPKTNVWNLGQVHAADGSASYEGNLRTDLETVMLGRRDLGQIGGQRLPNVAEIFGIEGSISESNEPLEDPYEIALENAVELASFDPGQDEEVRALQVETFGWLAADSAFPLVRERCALELGRVGLLLDLREPAALAADATPVGPEELLGLLRPVVSAARGSGDLQATADALRSATIDRAGLRRAVRTVTILRFGGGTGGLRLERVGTSGGDLLTALHDDLQRELVSQSLAAALDDENPHVRAAAVQATIVATDNGLPGLLQGAILRGGDEAVIVRSLELLEKRGIPRWDGATTAEEEAEYRRSWIGLCVGVLRNAFEGPIAIAAAQALKSLAPEGPDTLRPEEWIRWFDDSRSYGEAAERG